MVILLPLIQEGLLSVTSESICTEYWYWLTCPGSVVRLTNHLDMTIAVDWDIKPQTKQIKPDIAFSAHKELGVH